MNKIGKIISLALSAAICAGSLAIPVFATEVDETTALNNDEVILAAKDNFSIEDYPYSYVKTFDDDSQIKDHIEYNESSKYRNPLSTGTANPGYTIGTGYNDDGLVLTFYSGHRDKSYGGEEQEASYGNASQLWFITKNEVVYSNPTTGGQVGLTLSEATVGTNKVAFWTKTERTDRVEGRPVPETVSYSISFRNCGASGINVKIPNDGQWHYVVADLSVPFGEGFDGINVSSSCEGTFGSTNGGRPYLKLDGREGLYPVDSLNRPITDIDEAYVLVNGEYVRAKTTNIEYAPDPDGAYVNIPDAEGNAVYYRTDNVRYIETLDANGGITHVARDDGDLIFDIRSGKYITMTDPDTNFADRYTVSNVESYQIDESGAQVLDEEGNPIPVTICGKLVYEIWQQQIYIDEMLFYRTTESGKRTTFLPSNEDEVEYNANTDLEAVLVDGMEVYNVATNGDNRVITLPKDFDLSDPASADRIQVVTKTPDVIHAGQINNAVIVDTSELGTMKSGSVGSVILPATDSGKAIVTVTSALGTMAEYPFTLKWGYDLSVVATKGEFSKITRAMRQFDIKNYGEDEKTVQILAVIRDKDTNELKGIATDATNGATVAPGETATLRVTLPSVTNPDNCIAYFYFYDSIYTMNKVVSNMAIVPKN